MAGEDCKQLENACFDSLNTVTVVEWSNQLWMAGEGCKQLENALTA
jgi:hypothetical protein